MQKLTTKQDSEIISNFSEENYKSIKKPKGSHKSVLKRKGEKVYYCKKEKSEDRVKNEFLTSKMYKILGYHVPETYRAQYTQDKYDGIASEFDTKYKGWKDKKLSKKEKEKALELLAKGFVADVLLFNYDGPDARAKGTGNMGITKDDNGEYKAMRLDFGGGFALSCKG